MPWVSPSKYWRTEQYKEYNQLTNADLKDRLTRRGLPHTGKKAVMALRLTEDDEARPFPFMKLPADIRNEIYRLAATTHHFGRLARYNKPKGGGSYELRYDKDQATIVQPGIVCCSKQTRSEGLAIFFQAHHFRFNQRRWGIFPEDQSLLNILMWLDKLHTMERKNIRNITFRCSILNSDVPAMDRIHAMLSEKATVIYELVELEQNSSVLGVVRTFRSRCAGKAALHDVYSDDGFGPWARSLRFLPGLAWFGEQSSIDVEGKTEEE